MAKYWHFVIFSSKSLKYDENLGLKKLTFLGGLNLGQNVTLIRSPFFPGKKTVYFRKISYFSKIFNLNMHFYKLNQNRKFSGFFQEQNGFSGKFPILDKFEINRFINLSFLSVSIISFFYGKNPYFARKTGVEIWPPENLQM